MTASDETTDTGKIVGRPLFAAFAARCHELGLVQDEGASQVGISGSYLRALAKGNRNVFGLPFQTFINFANFLGRTIPQTLLLAEVLSPADFTVEEDIDSRFHEMMRHISHDSEFGPLFNEATISSMMGLSEQAKISVMLMYEQASHKRLLKQAGRVIAVNDQDQSKS